LIFALRSLLIASLSSSLLVSASRAPATVPSSFAGRSMDCCVKGILGSNAEVSPAARRAASSLRCCLAALRRSFLDLAGWGQLSSQTAICISNRTDFQSVEECFTEEEYGARNTYHTYHPPQNLHLPPSPWPPNTSTAIQDIRPLAAQSDHLCP